MINLHGNSINSVYRQLAQTLLCNKVQLTGRTHGEIAAELRNVTFQINDPYQSLLTLNSRDMTYRYAAGEFACFLQETESKEFAFYSKLWERIDVDGTAQSNLGAIIFGIRDKELNQSRFDYALNQLKNNKHSKNAVILLRDWLFHRPGYEKDRNCFLNLMFFIRDNTLQIDIYSRSSDFWLGLPYDVFWFNFVHQRMLHNIKAVYPELNLGTITYNIASLHVYQRHIDKLPGIINDNAYYSIRLPEWNDACEQALPYWLAAEKQLRRIGQVTKSRNFDDKTRGEYRTCFNELPQYLKMMGVMLLENSLRV